MKEEKTDDEIYEIINDCFNDMFDDVRRILTVNERRRDKTLWHELLDEYL